MLGIIGGSGLYDMDGLHRPRWRRVRTPWGNPSDEILTGLLGETPVAFLPRHGRGHRIAPSDVNYRANIHALKRLGVTDVLSVSAVGSLREDLPPGTFVIVDQFVDRTVSRARSFFRPGLVAHVSLADPVCRRLAGHLAEAARAANIPSRTGGTYVVIEGPQFSTRAESNLYRRWGCDVIGMTNMPEARLAREAELCYATLAMVTDWDCWHPDHGSVVVEEILAVLRQNVERARTLVRATAARLVDRTDPCPAGCHVALTHAIATAPESRTP
jgi:5'-methylthioadenosine phosphorylase